MAKSGDPPSPDECPELPDNLEPPSYEPGVLRKVISLSDKAYPSQHWKEDGKWRQYRWAYYRMIEKVDALIGEVLGALEESGELDNTILIFTSDHGDGMGSHRWNQKQVLYDEVARVPFLVAGPGIEKGTSDSLIAGGIDIIPTFMDYAGIPQPMDLPGRSIRPVAENKEVGRDHVICETEFCTYGDTYGIQGRMVRTDRFKYSIYSEGSPRDILIDMRNDPGEMKNLVSDPNFAEIVTQHLSLLRQWSKETEDDFDYSNGE